MNLDCLVKADYEPWLPNSRATDLDVWLAVDVPTVGTFVDGESLVLFSAVRDVDEPVTVWGYVCLSAAERAEARGRVFDDVPAMMDFVESKFVEREVVFAGAVDFKIWHWGRERGETLFAAASTFLQNWVRTSQVSAPVEVQFDVVRAGAEEYRKNDALAGV